MSISYESPPPRPKPGAPKSEYDQYNAYVTNLNNKYKNSISMGRLAPYETISMPTRIMPEPNRPVSAAYASKSTPIKRPAARAKGGEIEAKGFKKGGGVESKGKTKGKTVKMCGGGMGYKAGGHVASKRADGAATKGKTRCKIC